MTPEQIEQSSGERIIQTEPCRMAIVEPWKAAAHLRAYVRERISGWRNLRRLKRDPNDHLAWLRLAQFAGTVPEPDHCPKCRALADDGELTKHGDGSWSA